MSSKKVRFSPEFKEQLVLAFLDVEGRKTLSQFARDNGVGAETRDPERSAEGALTCRFVVV